MHRGGSRDHAQRANHRQIGNDLIRQPVGEELVVGIRAEIAEGQHGDRSGRRRRRSRHRSPAIFSPALRMSRPSSRSTCGVPSACQLCSRCYMRNQAAPQATRATPRARFSSPSCPYAAASAACTKVAGHVDLLCDVNTAIVMIAIGIVEGAQVIPARMVGVQLDRSLGQTEPVFPVPE